jgi:hypothetical protein
LGEVITLPPVVVPTHARINYAAASRFHSCWLLECRIKRFRE